MTALREMLGKPWLGAYIGAIAIWLATIAFTDGLGGGGVLTAALLATFSVLVATGQMFVITLGPGNVDLSIPATMTLAGAVSMKIMDGSNAMILPGLAIVLGCGAGVGVFNYGLIRLLRIPPIIATLSSSFLFLSAAISYSRLRIQAAAGARRLHYVDPVGVPGACPRGDGHHLGDERYSAPHTVRADRDSDRPECARRATCRPAGRPGALRHLCHVRHFRRPDRLPGDPASLVALPSTWARNTCWPRLPSW